MTWGGRRSLFRGFAASAKSLTVPEKGRGFGPVFGFSSASFRTCASLPSWAGWESPLFSCYKLLTT